MAGHLQPYRVRFDWALSAAPGPKANSVPFVVDQPARFAGTPHRAQALCIE